MSRSATSARPGVALGVKANDPDWLVETARQISQTARDVDETIETMPVELDAGPFTELIIDQIEAVCANTAALVLRLDAAATDCRRASGRYSDSELEAARIVKQVDDRLDLVDRHVPVWEQEDGPRPGPMPDPPGK